MNEASNILKLAKDALTKLETRGGLYKTAYVANRLLEASEQCPNDIFIHSMRDVMMKKQAYQEFVSKAEIHELYNRMYNGMSGKSSAFRSLCDDLLPESEQTKAYQEKTSSFRTEPLKTANANQKEIDILSNALMSSPKKISVATKAQAERVVKNALTTVDATPHDVNAVHENEHFILCAAIYHNGLTKTAIYIPYQKGVEFHKSVSTILVDNESLPLSRQNAEYAVKIASNKTNHNTTASVASKRDGKDVLQETKSVLPATLASVIHFDTHLVNAAKIHSTKTVSDTLRMLDQELRAIGAVSPQITIKQASPKELLCEASIQTSKGKVNIEIPVEVISNKQILPSKFAHINAVYDFSKFGMNAFYISESQEPTYGTVIRSDESYAKMSYADLMDSMAFGIQKKNYAQAEESLKTIETRFSDKFASSLATFASLLKEAAGNEEREKHIKIAQARGDLIHYSNYSELFCPKLLLPVSKIAFDEDSRPVPLYAKRKELLAEEPVSISTSKIHFT